MAVTHLQYLDAQPDCSTNDPRQGVHGYSGTLFQLHEQRHEQRPSVVYDSRLRVFHAYTASLFQALRVCLYYFIVV